MAMCKFCGKPFAWGISDGKYVPLVPIADHDDMVRSFQDENGVLRAEHRQICVIAGGPTVRVARLARPVQPEDILPTKKPVRNPEVDIHTILAKKAKKRAARKTAAEVANQETGEIGLRDLRDLQEQERAVSSDG